MARKGRPWRRRRESARPILQVELPTHDHLDDVHHAADALGAPAAELARSCLASVVVANQPAERQAAARERWAAYLPPEEAA